MIEAFVGLVLTLVGAFFGIYPALEPQDKRAAKAEEKRVTGRDMAWVNEHFREHITKPQFTDAMSYALSFGLIAVGSVLLAWPQLVS
ncbi:MAG: hypothetical protein OK452_07335 [Thaumarchaeota archaeon]|nr:hypothetical protein [Nitrososphaerota archaeon]